MNKKEKINWLEARLNQLSSNGKENWGVQRKIRREIRNLSEKR